jgi:hypothetical protein
MMQLGMLACAAPDNGTAIVAKSAENCATLGEIGSAIPRCPL